MFALQAQGRISFHWLFNAVLIKGTTQNDGLSGKHGKSLKCWLQVRRSTR